MRGGGLLRGKLPHRALGSGCCLTGRTHQNVQKRGYVQPSDWRETELNGSCPNWCSQTEAAAATVLINDDQSDVIF